MAVLAACGSIACSQDPRTTLPSQTEHAGKQATPPVAGKAAHVLVAEPRGSQPPGAPSLRNRLTRFSNAIATNPSDAFSAAPGASGFLALLFGIAALVIRKRRRH